jgi:hypothetical protein
VTIIIFTFISRSSKWYLPFKCLLYLSNP